MTPNTRRLLLALHRWLGVHFAVLLVLVCASGTLAVLGHDIDGLLDPATHAPEAAMNWEAIDASIRRELPAHELTFLMEPPLPGRAAVGFVNGPTGQLQRVLVDPGDGRILAIRNFVSPQTYVRELHRSLLLPWGIYLVGIAAFVLLHAVTTGLTSYPSGWKRLFRLRLRAKPTLRWSDIHRTVGLWVAAFAVVVSVTGVWYVIESVAWHAAEATFDPIGPDRARGPAVRDDDATLVGAQEAVDIAVAAAPGFTPTMIAYPHAAHGTMAVYGRLDTPLLRDYANRVHIDPFSGEVVEVRRAGETGAVSQWSNLADELHFGTLGEFGGLWSRLLYALLGLLLCVVAVAGPRLALVRQQVRIGGGDRAAVRGRSRWVRIGEGFALTVTLVAVFGAIVATNLAQDNPVVSGRGHANWTSGAQVHRGREFHVDAVAASPALGGLSLATYAIRWTGDPPPALRDVFVEVDDSTQEYEIHGLRQGEVHAPFVDTPRIRLVDHHDASQRIEVPLTIIDGAPASASMPYAEVEITARDRAFSWGVLGMLMIVVAGVAWSLYLPLRRSAWRG